MLIALETVVSVLNVCLKSKAQRVISFMSEKKCKATMQPISQSVPVTNIFLRPLKIGSQAM